MANGKRYWTVLLPLLSACVFLLYFAYLYFTHSSQTKGMINKHVQTTFEKMARNRIWVKSGRNTSIKATVSGGGSSLVSTAILRVCLGEWIKKYHISSIIDIPCGDGNWQNKIPGIDKVQYRGYDISPYAVERARRKNPKTMTFDVLDLTSDVPPKGDLIMLRDFIMHLPLDLGMRAIGNARKSGAKWIAISSFPMSHGNRNIITGCFYKVNIEKFPFYAHNVVERCDNGRRNGISKMLLFRNNDASFGCHDKKCA